MMNKWRISLIGIWCLFLISCGQNFTKRISIGMVPGWAEGEAMTLVSQVVLTRAGYHVVIQRAATNLLLASMNNGDTDAFMDVWLPKTHGKKVARFDNIYSAGINYNGALLGLVVPDYVSVQSINELNAHKKQFGGKIIGIERGSGIATATDSAIKKYHLDFTQLNSSTVAMMAELKKAINEKRWIVITGWKPHWMFARFKIKFLDDPKHVYGDVEHIETYVRKNLDKDYPDVYEFFKNFYLDDTTMSDLLAKIHSGDNKKKMAQQWVDEHQNLVRSWLGEG